MKFKIIIEAEYIPIKSNYPAGLTPKQMAELDQQVFDVNASIDFLILHANRGQVVTRVEVVEE